MAPAMFQWVMDTILLGFKWQAHLVYFDDVVVFYGIFQEHLQWLTTMLKTIRSTGPSLKA